MRRSIVCGMVILVVSVVVWGGNGQPVYAVSSFTPTSFDATPFRLFYSVEEKGGVYKYLFRLTLDYNDWREGWGIDWVIIGDQPGGHGGSALFSPFCGYESCVNEAARDFDLLTSPGPWPTLSFTYGNGHEGPAFFNSSSTSDDWTPWPDDSVSFSATSTVSPDTDPTFTLLFSILMGSGGAEQQLPSFQTAIREEPPLPSAVPEPDTWLLMVPGLVGLALLCVWRRRRYTS